MKWLIIFAFSVITLCSRLFSQIILPSVISDNMVLQQQSSIKLWGKSAPGRQIQVKTGWNKATYSTTTGNDSIWTVYVKTPEASFNAYIINIETKNDQKEIKNVLIGEVWLCSGQSNMEMPLRGVGNYQIPVENSLSDIMNSDNKYLRYFSVKKATSLFPQFNTAGIWQETNPNTAVEMSAVAFYYGQLLQQVLQVPIGLLHCSHGGSNIEAWMSPEALQDFPAIAIPESEAAIKTNIKHQTPTMLHNGMIHSIAGFAIKGAIWYQGEGNCKKPAGYPQLFKAMYTDWIKKWNCDDFPVYFCQLAPCGSRQVNTAFFREAQSEIAKTQINTAMAVLMDIGEQDNIHPSKKRPVGERLAYLALGKTYRYDKPQYESPVVGKINFSNDTASVKFIKAPYGLTTFGKELTGFEIAGEDKQFHPAKAVIKRDVVELTSAQVPKPVAVRYCFKSYAQGVLFGLNGLPVSSFRSDKWNDIIKNDYSK